MRLLTWSTPTTLSLTRDLSDDIPPYAILSHTWSTNDEEEVTFEDLQNGTAEQKPGYAKIEFCGQQARKDGLQYFWVDTCCINKPNLTELSEAITSMFKWYKNAVKCYVYLPDVAAAEAELIDGQHIPTNFQRSRWFTRGWTLQELLAPEIVEFYSLEHSLIGTKKDLAVPIHKITGIPVSALAGSSVHEFPTNDRLQWARGRRTKKKEDEAYCLLGLFDVYMPLIYGEGEKAFDRLREQIHRPPRSVSMLDTVAEAAYDAYGQIHNECHPATRTDLLHTVKVWSSQPTGKRIFWINGAAGTGKSTISFSMAKWFAEHGLETGVKLGASFFFKRGEGRRTSAKLLFSTIASHLAVRIKPFDDLVAEALVTDPQLCSKSLAEQFCKLIRDPLQRLHGLNFTYVIVLDALDECDKEQDIRTILKLWSTLVDCGSSDLRLLITSRPELPIRMGFRIMSPETHQDVILHEIPRPIIAHDIELYLRDRFRQIREEHNLEIPYDYLDKEWPSASIIQTLVQAAIPLFIIAATIVRHVNEASRPQDGLDDIMQSPMTDISFEAEDIYSSVLQASFSTLRSKRDETNTYTDFRIIVGTVIMLAEPLSVSAIAALLQIRPVDVQSRLRSLHAVLQVPEDGNTPVRPLHLSFGEYLTSSKLEQSHYGISRQATHARLWRQCLHLLTRGLKENICGLRYPGQSRYNLTSEHIYNHISPGVRYAGQYWIHHLLLSGDQLCDGDEVEVFLRRHFLHWLEVLCFVDRLTQSIQFMLDLQLIVANQNSNRIKALLEDARRFILANRSVCDQHPLQLYSYAVLFAPQCSFTRKAAGAMSHWITRIPATPMVWSNNLMTLSDGTMGSGPLCYSPRGSLLATNLGSSLGIWNARTGELALQVDLFESILSMAFSADESQLAVGGHFCFIAILDIATASFRTLLPPDLDGMFKPGCNDVQSLAFANKSSLLVSGTPKPANGSETYTIWNTVSGLELFRFGSVCGKADAPRYFKRFHTMSISSDDRFLSVRVGGSTEVWSITDINTRPRLRGDLSSSGPTVFSCDATKTVSLCEDGTVRFRDIATGLEVGALRFADSGSFDNSDLKLSCNDRLVIVEKRSNVSDRSSIYCYDVETGDTIRRTSKDNFVIAISPTAPEFASRARTGIRIWDISIKEPAMSMYNDCENRSLETSQDGRLLALLCNRTVNIWKVGTGVKLFSLHHKEKVEILRFDYRTTQLATKAGNIVSLWDIQRGSLKVELQVPALCLVSELAFSADGSKLAAAGEDFFEGPEDVLRVWNISTRPVESICLQHSSGLEGIKLSDDLELYATKTLSSGKGEVTKIHDMRTGIVLRTMTRYPGHSLFGPPHFKGFAFSHDGSQLLLVPSGSPLLSRVGIWNFARKELSNYRTLDPKGLARSVNPLEDGSGWATNLGILRHEIVRSPCGSCRAISEIESQRGLGSHDTDEVFDDEVVSTETLATSAYSQGCMPDGDKEMVSMSPSVSAHESKQVTLLRMPQTLYLPDYPEEGDHWLRCGDQKILWLPRESCGQAILCGKTTVAIPYYSEEGVTFIDIDVTQFSETGAAYTFQPEPDDEVTSFVEGGHDS